jgi:hypothetical protein
MSTGLPNGPNGERQLGINPGSPNGGQQMGINPCPPSSTNQARMVNNNWALTQVHRKEGQQMGINPCPLSDKWDLKKDNKWESTHVTYNKNDTQ